MNRKVLAAVIAVPLLALAGVVVGRQFALAGNTANSSSGNDPKEFTISGTVTGLAPGTSKVFQVSVANQSSQAIHVLTLSGALTIKTSPPAPTGALPCDASKITVTPYSATATGAIQYQVAGRASANIPLTAVFVNTTQNQDGCKGRQFTITYTGTAEQAH